MNFTGEELPTGFIGRSPRIVQIREQIAKLGLIRAPVLIQGETGCGKEVAARALYNANPRGLFVPIDCGSLVGPLMESELFGHARHAFTGAGEAKKGLIEQANGGTAFFDEIGDLPLDLQVKLLRVLQEHEYRPLGSLVRQTVDMRVISATHRDLAVEVARGNFRQDLYYRLNVIRVHIPALRERREDILPLIRPFLPPGKCYSLTNEAQEAMLAYDWPGNVRELSNCIQRMTALNAGPLLHTADLPSSLVKHLGLARGMERKMMASANSAKAGSLMEIVPIESPPSGILTLCEIEKRAILEALDHTVGDHTMAAQLLGIGRTTLY